MNVEVVRRTVPCRWYASDPHSTKCRSCQLLVHIRLEGTGTTLCGHPCTEDWHPLPDTHPKDIDALDRCMVCYARRPEYHKVAW